MSRKINQNSNGNIFCRINPIFMQFIELLHQILVGYSGKAFGRRNWWFKRIIQDD